MLQLSSVRMKRTKLLNFTMVNYLLMKVEEHTDIAVDHVKGTTSLAGGKTNALAVIVTAPKGSMLDPGPAFYM